MVGDVSDTDRTTPTSEHPPTAAEVQAVLDRLGSRVAERVAAALHLALPAGEHVGLSCVSDGAAWEWRGQRRWVPVAASVEQAARFAVELAGAGAADGDRWRNLAAGDAALVSVVRSGQRTVAWGCELLCGTTVAGDASIAAAVLVEVAALALGGRTEVPAVLDSGGGSHLVDGDAQLWRINPVSTSTDAPAGAEAPTMAWLAEEFDGRAVSSRMLGSRAEGTVDLEVQVSLEGGWCALVPVTLGWAGEAVGVPKGEYRPRRAQIGESLPGGFRLVGDASFDDGIVAEHARSGVRARLVRVS